MTNLAKIISISAFVLLMIPSLGMTNTVINNDTTRSTDGIEELDNLFNKFQKSDAIYQDLNTNYFEYVNFSLEHRKRVLTWQYFSTIIIFCVVVLIVVTGLFLSYFHFKRSLITQDNSETELELSKSGFKIRSSVIGILILTISIAFFYLYLTHVYEIKEIKPIDVEMLKPVSDY